MKYYGIKFYGENMEDDIIYSGIFHTREQAKEYAKANMEGDLFCNILEFELQQEHTQD